MRRTDIMTSVATLALMFAGAIGPVPMVERAAAQTPAGGADMLRARPRPGDDAGAAAGQEMRGSPPAGDPRGRADMAQAAGGRVSVEMFRDRLRDEGEWTSLAQFGDVFRPRGVGDDWQPYAHGRWIFNREVGWYFESDEPWAEITYHYGRWYEDPDRGWVWVPGTEWAPAWVEWRRSKDYVGWRPLPPDNAPRRTASRSERTTTTTTRSRRGGGAVEEDEWVFVPSDEITTEHVSTVRVRPERVTEIYTETRPVGRVERRGGIAVNFAIRPDEFERESHIRIESRNLPRAGAVPVPDRVRSISTEERNSASTGRPGAGEGDRGGAPAGTATDETRRDQTGTRQDDTNRATGTAEEPRRRGQSPAAAGETDRDRNAGSAAERGVEDRQGGAAAAQDQHRRKGQAADKATGPAGETGRAAAERRREPGTPATGAAQDRSGASADQETLRKKTQSSAQPDDSSSRGAATEGRRDGASGATDETSSDRRKRGQEAQRPRGRDEGRGATETRAGGQGSPAAPDQIRRREQGGGTSEDRTGTTASPARGGTGGDSGAAIRPERRGEPTGSGRASGSDAAGGQILRKPGGAGGAGAGVGED